MAPAVTVARCGYAKGCPSYQRSWAHRVRRLVLSGLAAASYAYCTEPAAFARPSGSPAALQIQGLGFIFVAGPMALMALLMSCLEPGCSLIVSLAGDGVVLALRVLRAPLRRSDLSAPF